MYGFFQTSFYFGNMLIFSVSFGIMTGMDESLWCQLAIHSRDMNFPCVLLSLCRDHRLPWNKRVCAQNPLNGEDRMTGVMIANLWMDILLSVLAVFAIKITGCIHIHLPLTDYRFSDDTFLHSSVSLQHSLLTLGTFLLAMAICKYMYGFLFTGAWCVHVSLQMQALYLCMPIAGFLPVCHWSSSSVSVSTSVVTSYCHL